MAQKRKVRAAVIFGGPSAEHEVSLNTGRNMAAALKAGSCFSVRPIKINKDGCWSRAGRVSSPHDCLKNIDVVCNALHGEFGEDGTIQGFLEAMQIPYTGSDMKSSVIGMDKVISKRLFSANGIKTPKFVLYKKGITVKTPPFKYPVVVKPNARGSSVGISVVKNDKEFCLALKAAFRYDKEVLTEEFIKGREITVGILDDYRGKKHYALPLTEIIPDKKHSFFNYQAKYEIGEAKEITPARISPILAKKAQRLGVKAYKAVGARHYARVDMILDNQDEMHVLEINTLPGMTGTSLLPQQAAAAGLPLPKLLKHIIGLAIKN